MNQPTPLDAFNQFLLSLDPTGEPAMAPQLEAAWAGMNASDMATRIQYFRDAVSLGLDPAILLTLALSHPAAKGDSIRAVFQVAQPDDKTTASFIFRILNHTRRIGMFGPLSEYGISGDFRMTVRARDKSQFSMPLFALLFGHHPRVEEALDFAKALPGRPDRGDVQMALVQLVRSTGMLCDAASKTYGATRTHSPGLQERASGYRAAFETLTSLGADWHEPATSLLLEHSDVEEKCGPDVTPAALLWGQLSQICFRNPHPNPFLEMVLELCNTIPEPSRMLVDHTGCVRRIVKSNIRFFHGHEAGGYFPDGLTPLIGRYMAPARALFASFSPRQILDVILSERHPAAGDINRYADFLQTTERPDATTADLGEVYAWLADQTLGFSRADAFQNLFLALEKDTRKNTPYTMVGLERVCNDVLKGPVGKMMKRDVSALWTTPHTPLMIEERVGLVKTTFDQTWLAETLAGAQGTKPVAPRL